MPVALEHLTYPLGQPNTAGISNEISSHLETKRSSAGEEDEEDDEEGEAVASLPLEP